MMEALVRLREAVANRNDEGPTLTPFVGAGFSSAATSGASVFARPCRPAGPSA